MQIRGTLNSFRKYSQTVIRRCAAFTRLELFATLAGVSLLLVLAIPMVATTKSQSGDIVCLSNLRQVGRAYNVWASDHGNQYPWMVNYSDGGLRNATTSIQLHIDGVPPQPAGIINNPWAHYAFLNRELETPRVLVCPNEGDGTRKMASLWDTNPKGGYTHGIFQNKATSYFIGLHANPAQPRQILSGDRHINYSGVHAGCSASIGMSYVVDFDSTYPSLGWRRPLHGVTGNVLFADGSAEGRTNEGLDNAWRQAMGGDGPLLHLLIP